MKSFTCRRLESSAAATTSMDEVVRMLRSAHHQIMAVIGTKSPEQGMMLGGDPTDGVVRHVVFDDSARRSRSEYSPDHNQLNRVLSEWWGPSGIRLLGFVHSHPGRADWPSHGDLTYAGTFLKANPHLRRLLLPIMTLVPEPTLRAFTVARGSDGPEVKPATLEVVDDAPVKASAPDPAANAPGFQPRRIREDTFRRVVHAYDLAHLSHCRVVVVGVGGSAGFVEDLARGGIHEFVLIDPDVVSASNLATQQVYRRDLGRSKVEVLAERLRDVNPAVEVLPLQRRLDELTEHELESTLGLDLARPPIRTLLCGCTDDFFTQAQINRLGLKHGVPTLCAQVYSEGRGAEITFTFPGLTPACHRCMLRSRYDAYFKKGYINTVTSDGTPISSTTRLNATKFILAMALLHHGTAHPRWGRLLERIGNRSLVQLRLDPDLSLSVFDTVLTGDRDRILCDEAVWLPQLPEDGSTGREPCPDCRGTGDLRNAIGTITDTRIAESGGQDA